MNFELLLPVALVMVFCAFVKGATGLGFSTLTLAILAVFLPLKVAIPLVVVPSLASNLFLMWQVGNFALSIRLFAMLFIASLPGMALGLMILHQADNTITSKVLAVVLLIYGLWGLWQLWQEYRLKSLADTEKHYKTFSIDDRCRPLLNAPIGFVTGLINGVTGSQIIPVMPYLLALSVSRDLFVQTINLSFTINSFIMLFGLQQMNLLSTQQLLPMLLLIRPVTIGVWMGDRIRKYLSERQFKQAVFILIVLMGLLILNK